MSCAVTFNLEVRETPGLKYGHLAVLTAPRYVPEEKRKKVVRTASAQQNIDGLRDYYHALARGHEGLLTHTWRFVDTGLRFRADDTTRPLDIVSSGEKHLVWDLRDPDLHLLDLTHAVAVERFGQYSLEACPALVLLLNQLNLDPVATPRGPAWLAQVEATWTEL